MTDPSKTSADLIKKISRRNMLRNTALTASGAVLLQPFMTGCSKLWDFPGGHGGHGGGVGDLPLTPEQLQNAADNLNRMRALLNDLYQNTFDYDEVVFLALSSTTQQSSWTNFIVDIIIDIAIAVAATVAVATANPLVVPALACLSAFLHDWGIGKDRPLDLAGLNGFFAGYQDGQLAMKKALDEKLGHLTDKGNNPNIPFPNLLAAWKDPIILNDKPFTLLDLANSYFPDKTDHADEYYKLYNPMYDHHRKSVWNLAVMKCCTYYRNYSYYIQTPTRPGGVLLSWARDTFYKENKGAYIRAVYQGEVDDEDPPFISWEIDEYWLGIGGNQFPDAASDILFKDDTPGHIINPAGLFNRSYVFEQFSIKKYEFPYGHELGNDEIGNLHPEADDFEFTGGLFPRLIEE